jgi:uncharacterized protein YigE (DUF2233 family)
MDKMRRNLQFHFGIALLMALALRSQAGELRS